VAVGVVVGIVVRMVEVQELAGLANKCRLDIDLLSGGEEWELWLE